MVKAKKYNAQLPNWLAKVSAVWQEVPDLTVYFKISGIRRAGEYVERLEYFDISRDIEREWDQKKERLSLHFPQTQGATRSSLAAMTPTYSGFEAPEFSEEAMEELATSAGPLEEKDKKKQDSRSRRKRGRFSQRPRRGREKNFQKQSQRAM